VLCSVVMVIRRNVSRQTRDDDDDDDEQLENKSFYISTKQVFV